jgi:A/G-specific adenine glycosylase
MKGVATYSFKFEKIKPFRKAVVTYYRNNGRKSLPWRNTSDPWKILLSEFLLRKTTVKQVIPIYLILSNLTIDEINSLSLPTLKSILKPLGIQEERSRLIKILANHLIDKEISYYQNFDELIKIPGIGRYSVAAVQCFAFDKVYPALDRNMIRLLDRVFSILSIKKRPHMDNMLWNTAKIIVHPKNPKEYNWGVLDLSADLCRPKNPKCTICDCKYFCDFFQKRE